MARTTKIPPAKGPRQRALSKSNNRSPSGGMRAWWLPAVVVLAVVAIGVPAAYVALRDGGVSVAETTAGLPDTPDYHSLLVSPSDPDALVLGTHAGLYRSADGGRTWRKAELDGNDAMNLAQPSADTVWAAGHLVLAKSTDGGATWLDVRPDGLPSLDVHAFAVDPDEPSRLYAAVAGEGLFRSDDGGASVRLLSEEVGGGVFALAVLPGGTVLAGDLQRRALVASDDEGASWKELVQASISGLAVDPSDPSHILASGPGVLRSTDAGKNWTPTLELPDGSGPVAFSAGDPQRVYVVGFDRTLYRSDDGGARWSPVPRGEAG
jgi:photosystem II stability/assembly factor-like uncharacterized protein